MSFQTLNYQTTDKNPSSGISYYRLKQIDLDGKVSYSDLVAIKIIATSEEISISPNPVTNGMITIRLQNHADETIQTSVMDLNGKILIANTEKPGDSQQSSIVIDQLGTLPTGIYIVRIESPSGIHNKKITVY